MVSVIFPVVLKSPVGVGSHMPRDRCQLGWVHEVGKHMKKWRGDDYVYERLPDGHEMRKHRSVILGLKCQMKKWEAEKALRDILLNPWRWFVHPKRSPFGGFGKTNIGRCTRRS